MRFGLDYHRHFVPEWSGFYVQYDLIKSHLKSGIHTVDSSVQLLSADVEAFVSFHRDQLCILGRRETALWNIFDEPQNPRGFQPCERNFLLGELNAVLDELLKLQWFDRINREAIDRLFRKLHHVLPQSESSHVTMGPLRSRWSEQQQTQRLELSKTRKRLESSISRINETTNASNSTESPLLRSVLGMSLDIPLFQDALSRALNDNGPDASKDLFTQLAASPEAFLPEIGHRLFAFFVIQRSWQNALTLLEQIASRGSLNFGHDDIRLLITVYIQEIHGTEAGSMGMAGYHRDVSGGPSALDVFGRILELLGPASVKELFTKRTDEPLLLHLLAKDGLLEWCRLALDKIQETGETLDITATILSADGLKLTPLHYALIYHHPDVMDFFSTMLGEDRDEYKTSDCQDLLASYLSLAVEFGENDIVAQISRMINLDHKSTYGSSALHVAAREGRIDIIALLLQAGANVNGTEHPRGRTPLIEATVNGWAGAVQYLIEHGADAAITDCMGWTAKDLATYRGNLAIAELIRSTTPSELDRGIEHAFRPTKSNVRYGGTEPGDIFISVNLGPMHVRRNSPAIQLKTLSTDSMEESESLYRLKISGAGQAHRIKLPILDDRSNAPLIFVFPQDADMQLTFKIFREDPEQGEDGVLVCGGTALLECNKLLFGATRQSLVREHTVSILDSTTLNIAGSILFTYVIAKQFPYLQSPKYSLTKVKSSESSVMLVGHRGLGQNILTRDYLQIGENTVESFIAASNAGASFVEPLLTSVDVQITRDFKPVIYHNFSLSETGTDIPIHDVTMDQYQYASLQASQPIPSIDQMNSLYAKARPRSLSVGSSGNPSIIDVRNKLKYTVDFKAKGMKSNTRGHVIQQPLTTLREVFDKLPETVGFNIEIKYPRFHETVDASVAPIGPELNLCVDTVLEHVYLYGGDRPIILSSFTPEICILLSLKQKAYPVMFITNAGKMPMIDVERRAASMQTAVKFAKLWNLAGIVFASEPLVLCPRLIRYVKSFGLVCASYGPQNSIPEDAIAQVRAGIDILIADRVGRIAKTLKELE
ncbi:Glycerophosphoryl diester phosphodiesterase family-domain-containing protein [Xylaria sp. FL1777]|nr:Glycerophosphoryl diester phosphodiesterase family-domain-containing protein [Xylaria sp. FL1777]